MAAGAITKEPKLLFLDAIFHLTPRAVNLIVEGLGATFQIGQNITRLNAFYGVFGFRNDLSFPVPTLTLILKLSEEQHFPHTPSAPPPPTTLPTPPAPPPQPST